MKLTCIFTIIQLNRSIVHDIEQFISEGNSIYIYIYIYIHFGIYILRPGVSSLFILLIIYLIWHPMNHFYLLKMNCRTLVAFLLLQLSIFISINLYGYIYMCVYIIYIYMYIYKTMCPTVITTMALWQLMYLGIWCMVTHGWY